MTTALPVTPVVQPLEFTAAPATTNLPVLVEHDEDWHRAYDTYLCMYADT